MATDGPKQHLWRPLANFLLYDGREKIGQRGNLTLVNQALSTVEAWFTAFPIETLEEPIWLGKQAALLSFHGNLAVARGNLEDASQFFQQALEIRQRLAQADPDNSSWQRDLAVSHFKLFQLAQKAEDQEASGKSLLSCYQILTGMKQRNMHLDPSMAQLHDQLKTQFSNSEDPDS